jgi:hypothetical protein
MLLIPFAPFLNVQLTFLPRSPVTAGVSYWIYCLIDIYTLSNKEAIAWCLLLLVVSIPQISSIILRFIGNSGKLNLQFVEQSQLSDQSSKN